MKKKHYWLALIVAFLFCFPVPSFAEAEADSRVIQMLNGQLEALKDNSYENFMRRGNRAFRELFTKFDFETLYLNTKSELGREYDIKYLGSIRRVGMIEYLWKFKNTDAGNEHLVRLTLGKNGEYVVGFDFD